MGLELTRKATLLCGPCNAGARESIAGKITVKGPGQKTSSNLCGAAESLAHSAAWAQSAAITGIGLSAGRIFILYINNTDSFLFAMQPMA